MKKNQFRDGRLKSAAFYNCINFLHKEKNSLIRSISRERKKQYKKGYFEYKKALRILEQKQWEERSALYRSYEHYVVPYVKAQRLWYKLSGYWAKSKNKYDKKINEIETILLNIGVKK